MDQNKSIFASKRHNSASFVDKSKQTGNVNNSFSTLTGAGQVVQGGVHPGGREVPLPPQRDPPPLREHHKQGPPPAQAGQLQGVRARPAAEEARVADFESPPSRGPPQRQHSESRRFRARD